MDGDLIVSADVTCAPSTIADAMQAMAEACIKGSAMPATMIIPSVLVTKENASKYYFPDSPF
jgi:ribose transport system substrate-binding protein